MKSLKTLIVEVGKRCPGGRLPDSYLVVDVETSGFGYKREENPDVIVQFGYAAVQHRELVNNSAFLIKRPPGTMKGMALEVTGITDEMLEKQGHDAKTIYTDVLHLIKLYKKHNCMFVGHNIVAFDAPFIHHDFKREGFDFEFDLDRCLDTGVIFKAAQMGLSPTPSESLTKFQRRIRHDRSSVKWKLALAAEMLELGPKFGVDMENAHDAGYDCMATHYVLEALRRKVGL